MKLCNISNLCKIIKRWVTWVPCYQINIDILILPLGMQIFISTVDKFSNIFSILKETTITTGNCVTQQSISQHSVATKVFNKQLCKMLQLI